MSDMQCANTVSPPAVSDLLSRLQIFHSLSLQQQLKRVRQIQKNYPTGQSCGSSGIYKRSSLYFPIKYPNSDFRRSIYSMSWDFQFPQNGTKTKKVISVCQLYGNRFVDDRGHGSEARCFQHDDSPCQKTKVSSS